MEQKKLRRRELEPMIGSRGRVSEVLSRKRALTLPMIRRLAVGLDLPADILIREAPAGTASGKRERAGAKAQPKRPRAGWAEAAERFSRSHDEDLSGWVSSARPAEKKKGQ